MGSPELPNEQDGECMKLPGAVHSIHAINSDDSDIEETGNDYSGYSQLQMIDNEMEASDDDNDESLDNDADGPGNNEENNVISVDAEIENEVWNAPRPNELQNIVLDSTRTEEIINVMAGIQLPNMSIPQWAQGVPEERWKEDLLQKIRQRQTDK